MRKYTKQEKHIFFEVLHYSIARFEEHENTFFTFSSISEFIDNLFKNRFDDINHEIIIRSFQNYIMNHQKDSQIGEYCGLMSDLFLEFLYYKLDQITPIKE